jgi:hypothetical protein
MSSGKPCEMCGYHAICVDRVLVLWVDSAVVPAQGLTHTMSHALLLAPMLALCIFAVRKQRDRYVQQSLLLRGCSHCIRDAAQH